MSQIKKKSVLKFGFVQLNSVWGAFKVYQSIKSTFCDNVIRSGFVITPIFGQVHSLKITQELIIPPPLPADSSLPCKKELAEESNNQKSRRYCIWTRNLSWKVPKNIQ